MSNWIHCNKCVAPFNERVPMFVGECGHLECRNCFKSPDLNKGNCSICGKTCQHILLSKDMRPDLLCFFKPVALQLDQFKKTFEFQEKQRTNLLSQLSAKYSCAKKEIVKCRKIIDSQRNDIVKLKEMLKCQWPDVERSGRRTPLTKGYTTSTPMSRTNSISPFADLTTSSVKSSDIHSTIQYSGRPGSAKRVPVDISPASDLFPSANSSGAHVVPRSRETSLSRIWSNRRRMFSPMDTFPNIHHSR